MAKQKVLICTKGKACRKRGSKELFCAMAESIENLGLEDEICLKKTDCMGHCGRGPAIKVKPDKLIYGWVSRSDIREILWSLVSGKRIKRLTLKKKAS